MEIEVEIPLTLENIEVEMEGLQEDLLNWNHGHVPEWSPDWLEI